ncbi:MAG: metal ABC transporter permease [Coraliomargaritaceae bacterium]
MFDGAAFLEVLSLRDYNTRLVVVCSLLLGAACGPIGVYFLLRRRSLMGDVLSHATLPGVALAFLFSVWLGGDGKFLPWLLMGAALTGLLGCGAVQFIRVQSRIKDDAAMGIVLSVFFGAGIVLLGFIQSMPQGSAAGLESFIYGKTASMVKNDFFLLSGVALVVLLVPFLFFKELRLLCFDEGYARVQGWPVQWLDVCLLGLLTLIVVAGLQAVGLVLIIAFLVIPAASARFWTERLDCMLVLSAFFGGASGWIGAALSALAPGLPSGALIVLVASVGFLLSLVFGLQRGLAVRLYRYLVRQGHGVKI